MNSKAINILEKSKNHIFITGNAGTGKSTLLEKWRATTKQKVAVLAPTGVAALNVKGQTIHSFFGFRPDITTQKIRRYYRKKGKKGLFKKIDTIVIDEISMVRADLLDCIDVFLRIHGKTDTEPFGGVRMVFIGDLHQLPPIVKDTEKKVFETVYKTPYFFSANVFNELELEFIELTKIYRQTDKNFINLLSAIRANKVTEKHVEQLNTRFDPQFETPANTFFITLTTTNKTARKINEYHLAKLFNERFSFSGKTSGKFDTATLPTTDELELKVGAQIMMVANDKKGRWVNGTLGKVIGILPPNSKQNKSEETAIQVELDDKSVVAVLPHTWELFKMNYNPATDKLQTDIVGTYTQYPLTLAWAITIHKSQGKTFDNVIIDFGWGTFAHGQAYVALSRATSLKGIVLTKSFSEDFIITDERINTFLRTFKYLTKSEIGEDEKQLAVTALILSAIEEQSLLRFLDSSKNYRTIKPMEFVESEKKLVGHCYTEDEILEFSLSEISELRELSGIS